MAPDWRERGLDKAVQEVEAGRPSRNLWVWLKINEGSRDFWEPGAGRRGRRGRYAGELEDSVTAVEMRVVAG